MCASIVDVRHLHVDSSDSRQCDQPSLPIGSSTHADASLTIQTRVSHESRQLTLLPSSNRSSSAAMGATIAPTAVFANGHFSGWRAALRHRDWSGASDVGLSSLIAILHPTSVPVFREVQIKSCPQQSAHGRHVSGDIRHIHFDACWDGSLISFAMEHRLNTCLAMCFNFLILDVPQLRPL